MKLVGWEHPAAQGVPDGKSTKGQLAAASAEDTKRPVDVCPAPTEAERRRRSVPLSRYQHINSVLPRPDAHACFVVLLTGKPVNALGNGIQGGKGVSIVIACICHDKSGVGV